MMPDATSVGASHDIVQILFWFVVALGTGMAAAATWIGKYMLLPFRDRHFEFLSAQIGFMETVKIMLTKMEEKDAQRFQMHQDNLRKLSDLHKLAEATHNKIKCDLPRGPLGAAGHV
jgi:hypothetical protein